MIDEAIERSAAPAAVALALDQLEQLRPGLRTRLATNERLTYAVVAVTAASRMLTRVLARDARALDVLDDLDHRPPVDATNLSDWKDRELLRIAARDLTGRDALEAVGEALAALAEDVLAVAAGPDVPAVIGMGKLGGRELNYASDIDVLFVGEDEAAAREVMRMARTCFRVDADLRPEGGAGPLVRTLESYEAYWDRWAQAWEFQALLKARPVAGDADLGRKFAAAAAERVWGRPFGADELRQVRGMKARAEGELARRGLLAREVKRGHGGIRDIEFAVQLLQLVHGRTDPALRSPTTLTALGELAAAGYVAVVDADALDAAYRFLRAVEHRLQLVEGQQVHAIPTQVGPRAALARVLGYRDDARATAVDRFDEELRRHQASVRSIHERLFFRPLLEAFTGVSAMASDAVEARLTAFGFADVERTRQALRELTRGLTRSSRLMQQMLPLLLEWLSESPDPDLGLLGLRTLAAGTRRSPQLVATFRDSPEAARRLCLLLGTSRLSTTAFEHHPELIRALADDHALASSSRAELAERAAVAFPGGSDGRARGRRSRLRRLANSEVARIATRDILGFDGVEDTASSLTALAEAVLEAALAALAPAMPMAVVAMGRFGGEELSYASDLDVMLVYDGASAADFAAAEETAEALLRFVKGDTPSERIFMLDTDLRPEGKQGPLARSVEGYATYYERWAQVWERQALVRARPVAGDAEVGARFMELVEGFVWQAPFTEAEAREIRRVKARVERERLPAGDDPHFHLKLGRGSLSDVEWTAQLLQLQHDVRSPGTMTALDRLEEAGVLAADDAVVLRDAYRFCERTRNRWYLVRGAPGDALPTQASQLARLARSLDTTATGLREEYRRFTRRARDVVERLFYGRI